MFLYDEYQDEGITRTQRAVHRINWVLNYPHIRIVTTRQLFGEAWTIFGAGMFFGFCVGCLIR